MLEWNGIAELVVTTNIELLLFYQFVSFCIFCCVVIFDQIAIIIHFFDNNFKEIQRCDL